MGGRSALSFSLAFLALSLDLGATTFQKDLRFRTQTYLFPEEAPGILPRYAEAGLLADPRFELASEDGNRRLAFEPVFYSHFREESSHGEIGGDIGELSLTASHMHWRFSAGLSRVFWGAAESYNPTDIMNQRDLRREWQGDQKLGQSMASLSFQGDMGTLEGYLATYARELRMRGLRERLNPFPYAFGDPRFESEFGRWHPDMALRWSKRSRAWETGLSLFQGTGREPYLNPTLDQDSSLLLIPTYVPLTQAGVELTALVGEVNFKLEGIYRIGDSFQSYLRYAIGIEYAFLALTEGGLDLALYAEHLYSNESEPLTYVDNDAFLGFRVDFNNSASTSVEAGVVVDLESRATMPRLEIQHRLAPFLTLVGMGQVFLFMRQEEILLYPMRLDSHVSLELRFFL